MAYCEIKSINATEKTYGDHLVVKNISVVDGNNIVEMKLYPVISVSLNLTN